MSDVKQRPIANSVNNDDWIVIQSDDAGLGDEKRVRVSAVSGGSGVSTLPKSLRTSRKKVSGTSIINFGDGFRWAESTGDTVANNFETGTGTITCTTGSPTVTLSGGSFLTVGQKVAAGKKLFNSSNVLIGTIKSVNSATSITLGTPGGADANALVAVTAGAFKTLFNDSLYCVASASGSFTSPYWKKLANGAIQMGASGCSNASDTVRADIELLTPIDLSAVTNLCIEVEYPNEDDGTINLFTGFRLLLGSDVGSWTNFSWFNPKYNTQGFERNYKHIFLIPLSLFESAGGLGVTLSSVRRLGIWMYQEATKTGLSSKSSVIIRNVYADLKQEPKATFIADDGIRNEITTIAKVMQGAGVPMSIGINAAYVGDTNLVQGGQTYASWPEFLQFQANGGTILNHGYTHRGFCDRLLYVSKYVTSATPSTVNGAFTIVKEEGAFGKLYKGNGTTAVAIYDLTSANQQIVTTAYVNRNIGDTITLKGGGDKLLCGTFTIDAVFSKNLTFPNDLDGALAITLPTAPYFQETNGNNYGYFYAPPPEGYESFVVNDLVRNRTECAARGITEGMNDLIAPSGAFHADIIPYLKAHGFRSCRTTRFQIIAQAGAGRTDITGIHTYKDWYDEFQFPVLWLDDASGLKTAVEVLGRIDRSVSVGCAHTDAYMHQCTLPLLTSTGGGSNFEVAELYAIAGGVAQRQASGSVEFEDYSEFVDGLGL